MSRPLRLALPALLAFALAACDSTITVPEGEPGPTPNQQVAVERGAAFPDSRGDDFGIFSLPFSGVNSTFGDGPLYSNATVHSIATTALWLTGTQNGQERYSAAGPIRRNTGPCEVTTPHEPFRLASGVDYELGAWPVALGAPLTASGAPRVYGDLMVWDAFCSGQLPDDTRDPAPADEVLQDLRITRAVFQHERLGLEGARFFRYEITNLGDTPVTDFRAAFYNDADLGGRDYHKNLMGSADTYAYVYMSDAAPAEDDGAVTAFALLQTPKDAPEAIRRAAYRDDGPAPDEAALGTGPIYQTPRPTLFRALRGLDNEGDPIRNPSTNELTTVMYDGDPVARTGWLDGSLPNGANGFDIRVLQATAPITLAPGQSVVMTAVVIATVQADLAAGLASVDERVRDISADPSLWRFPVAAP